MMHSILSLLLLLGNITAGYLLPHPSGKYNLTLTDGLLVDYKRNDPFSATPKPRALMLSVFEPATCASTVAVPYMPNKTAEYQSQYVQKTFNVSGDFTPLFVEAQLPVCSNNPSSCSPQHDGSILLFSPGWGIPRFYYHVIASAIASEGFVVITIDHPEDANIITYPDGHVVYNNYSTYTDLAKSERVRAADASFIIDQLSNATAIAKLLPHRGLRPFPTDRVAMLGHSLGGASSVFAALQDCRIRGAIDWDGSLFGDLPRRGLSPPVLYMSEANATDPTWVPRWPLLKGPKLWVNVTGTTHETFSDIPTLLQAAGQNAAPFEELLGTIASAKMVRILVSSTTAWMTGAFAGKERELPKFPEVSTVKKENF